MNIDEIEVSPLAAESFGIRSLCTHVQTPDVSILLDPSAALAKRYNLEPHPFEYKALQDSLDRINLAAQDADLISISHYHYDHVRPGFTNFLYNLSTKNERKQFYKDKVVHAKDNRDNINSSQRRRAFFFQKDVKSLVREIQWIDGKEFVFGDTKIKYSKPLPHGPEKTPLGFVIATTIEHSGTKILFAPDVQGPVSKETLSYIISEEPKLAIIGGPPLYLNKIHKDEIQAAFYSLSNLASIVSILVIDHHILRDRNWREWISPIINLARETGNSMLTMADLAGKENMCLESERGELYKNNPPNSEFLDWTNKEDEYKIHNMPPI